MTDFEPRNGTVRTGSRRGAGPDGERAEVETRKQYTGGV